jgi:hypothetical protein
VWVDALQEHFLEDALDQLLLGRKIAIEQGLGDAETLRQLARLAGEADLGEEADGFGENLLLAIGRGESPVRLGGSGLAPGAQRRPAVAACGRASAPRGLSGGSYGCVPFGGMIGSSR